MVTQLRRGKHAFNRSSRLGKGGVIRRGDLLSIILFIWRPRGFIGGCGCLGREEELKELIHRLEDLRDICDDAVVWEQLVDIVARFKEILGMKD